MLESSPEAFNDDIVCPAPPVPSMLIRMLFALIALCPSSEVYRLPRSVLKNSGILPLSDALSSIFRHNLTSMSRPMLQPSTYRLSQSRSSPHLPSSRLRLSMLSSYFSISVLRPLRRKHSPSISFACFFSLSPAPD